MKITRVETIFEGSPEEYARAQPYLNSSGARPDHVETAPFVPSQANGGPKPELSLALIEAALTRRSMSKHQRKVLDTILNAGDEGIYASSLADKVGLTRNKLAGVFGATGRREENTPGWPKRIPGHRKKNRMVEAEWDGDRKEKRYWLHPLVREVLLSGRVKI